MDEAERYVKTLNAIAAIQKDQLESVFYLYRPHRSHLTTRFGHLFLQRQDSYTGGDADNHHRHAPPRSSFCCENGSLRRSVLVDRHELRNTGEDGERPQLQGLKVVILERN